MSRELSARGLALVTVFSIGMLALGAAVAFRPEQLLAELPELEGVLAALDPAVVIFLAALVLVLLAPALGVLGRVRAPAPSPLRSEGESDTDGNRTRPEASAGTPSAKLVGGSFDRHIETATAYETRSQDERTDAKDRLIEQLRELAAETLAARAGLDRERALEAVEAGEWTDDARASAFLAGESGPSTPIWIWLLDLLTASDPFERSLEHTIDELETLRSQPVTGGSEYDT